MRGDLRMREGCRGEWLRVYFYIPARALGGVQCKGEGVGRGKRGFVMLSVVEASACKVVIVSVAPF